MIVVVNILYFVGVSQVHSGVLFSQLLFYGSLVDVVLGLAALVKRAWSMAIILLSFASMMIWMSIDFAT